MCPVCIASATLIVAGASSAGGLTTLAIKRLRSTRQPKRGNPNGKESKMQHNRIVSRDEWLAARKEHLRQEKELTRLRDELSRQRRELPWVKVEKPYVFGPNHDLTDWVRHHDRYGDAGLSARRSAARRN